MAPIVLGAVALASFLGYEVYKKKTAVQVQRTVSASGVPVQIVTPIAPVTQAQVTATPSPAAASSAAVAQVVPGQGTVYAPPKMVDVLGPGLISMAPILVTPTGSSSVAIAGTLDVQKALNTLGYTPRLKEDGKLGPATIANIKNFQKKVGIVVDGSAGPATKAAVSNALATFVSGTSAPVATAATAAVAAGKASPVVTAKDVQHALNLLGAKPPLQEDGKPGPKTIAALKSFQLTHGLAVDGVAGPKTKAALSIALTASTPTVSGQFGVGWS
jgi:peptidoglycan hydrolase-like protein with peptidoglycan-binding domain